MTMTTARTPGPYDGYISETSRGYEVSADGVLIGTRRTLGQAKVLLMEHCAGKPCWYVSAAGMPTQLDCT